VRARSCREGEEELRGWVEAIMAFETSSGSLHGFPLCVLGCYQDGLTGQRLFTPCSGFFYDISFFFLALSRGRVPRRVNGFLDLA
jgi:hypothetical protein